jgi:hypothetical protein
MKKLKLSLEALEVESFQTDETLPPLGTVRGNQEEEPIEAGLWSWLVGTCDDTCKISCGGAGHTLCLAPYCRTFQCPDPYEPADPADPAAY